jgi:hypothetical protein
VGDWAFLLYRPAIVSLAVSGALIASLGPYFLKKVGFSSPRLARLITRIGYALSWVSVGFFIAAGFIGNR